MQEIVAVKGRRVFCLVERVGAPTPEQLYPERLTVRLAFATYVVNVNYNWEIILLEDGGVLLVFMSMVPTVILILLNVKSDIFGSILDVEPVFLNISIMAITIK